MTAAAALRKIVTPEVREHMDRALRASIRALIPHRINRVTVSEWAEAHRILPSSVTPMPGPFRFDLVPYMREIADCFSESSPVQKVVVMKGAQVAFTTAVLENVVGFIIAHAPGPAMFISADKGVAEASMELRLDAMIESAGLAERIFAQVVKKHGKKTGDTKARKDFPGGFLMAVGPRVGAKLRSFAVRYLLGDEVDAWPAEIGGADKGKTASEGDVLALAERRTVSFLRTRKVLLGSTPLIKQTSRIERLFREGDQRYFHVPCPKCGHMQPLRWRDAEGHFRLRYALEQLAGTAKVEGEGPVPAGTRWIHHGHAYVQAADVPAAGGVAAISATYAEPAPGVPDSAGLADASMSGRLVPGTVRYECEKCGALWPNEDKAWFLPRGRWVPTATAREPGLRSYHLSALLAPLGMRTFESVIQEWIGIDGDVAKLRTFINTTLGETFEEKGWAPRPERVKSRNAEAYAAGELPSIARPLVWTAGVDVQDDRIAVEVVAWGRDMESWSIEYVEIPGDTNDLTSEAWRGLHMLLNTEHNGRPLDAALIDEGGHRTEQARRFAEDFGPGVHTVKGEAWGRRGGGVFSRREIPGHDRQAVMLNVDSMKEIVFGFLSKGTADGAPPREPFAGYCHFPFSYPESFYRMLCSEERFLDRGRDGRQVVKWRKIHTRNEALDCRVYALGALYVFFEDWRRAEAKEDETELAHGWGEFWTVGEREREQQERGVKARK